MHDTRALTDTFGAEVIGIDLAAVIDPAAIESVRGQWHERKIVLFRDQRMTESDLVRFSRHFGRLEIHVRKEYLSRENPEVLLVSNMTRDGKPIGILSDVEVGWHYDQIYLERPAVGSLLYAVKIPPEGGRTSFADLGAAYDALPASTKRRIDGRTACQSYEHFNRLYSEPTNEEQKKRTPNVHHPIARTHPYTGSKALYICPGMTTRIIDLPEDESDELLRELFEWCVRPEFVYTHEWQVGDALMWDNACTMHRRERFDGQHERLMKRTTILPDPELAIPF